MGDGDGAAYVWKERAGVRFLEEGANLEILVFRVGKNDSGISINFIRNPDVTFTPSKPHIGVHVSRCTYTQSYSTIYLTHISLYIQE